MREVMLNGEKVYINDEPVTEKETGVAYYQKEKEKLEDTLVIEKSMEGLLEDTLTDIRGVE